MNSSLSTAAFPDTTELHAMAAKFAPAPLAVDTSRLSAGDRQALLKLIEAGRVIDDLFMRQLWSGDVDLYHRLQRDDSPLGQARLNLFRIYKGPWSDLDEHRAFLPGVPERKPPGANFYPVDMTRQEFEHWTAGLPEKDAQLAKSFFTVIRRNAQTGQLEIVPYHREWRDDLQRAAMLLRDAAALTGNSSLKHFLETRAAAFLNDDYYESDLAWMDLDSPIAVTIGPYETYNDELFGYKAAFEAYVCVKDEAGNAESAELFAPFAGSGKPPANRCRLPQSKARNHYSNPRRQRSAFRWETATTASKPLLSICRMTSA